MEREDLIEAIAGDLFTYVLEGELPEDDIAALVKPFDFPEQYNDFDRLVNLHFLLREDVRTFTAELEDRLRGIKTETTAETRVQRGGIDGRVDWESTYRKRSTSSPGNRSLYVVESQAEQYAIPENLVLKVLINTIKASLEDVNRYLKSNRTWAVDTWVGEHQLREEFTSLAERSYHLQRIPDTDRDKLTDRMITRAASSRQDLYRDAANLLTERERYETGDRGALQSLLSDTAITPQKTETLFELFVLFRTLDALRTLESPQIGTPTYHTITSGRDAVATFDGDTQLRVYYNQTPRDPNISFKALPESEPAQSRSDFVHRTSTDVADAFFTDTNIQNHTKRPDVFVVASRQEEPVRSYLAIEVKDSRNQQTIRQGITELLEYLNFMRREGEYPFAPGKFGCGLNGILVVQDLDDTGLSPASLAEQSKANLPIRIVQASHVETVLPAVIRRLFDPPSLD
ncbi:hypothetical protein [Natrononativus amylolyticus]|uniref:hypothetical protein n=1 Tax=Natrononativus amylolyticus TaxID=2963434 RepID=UPI0020CC0503|nr:hypothetical protein [Natrononativus amylolyticus]